MVFPDNVKFEKFVNYDEVHEILQFIYFDGEKLIATNKFTAVMAIPEISFRERELKELIPIICYLHAKSIKKNYSNRIAVNIEKNYFVTLDGVKFPKPPHSPHDYPDKSIKKIFNEIELQKKSNGYTPIGLNPILLSNALKAVGHTNYCPFNVYFNKNNISRSPILVQSSYDLGVMAVMMPLDIEEEK